jgi:hypothetical protein
LAESEHFAQLNAIAISQVRSLLGATSVKRLENAPWRLKCTTVILNNHCINEGIESGVIDRSLLG